MVSFILACEQTSPLPQDSSPDFSWGSGDVCTQATFIYTFENYLNWKLFYKMKKAFVCSPYVTRMHPYCYFDVSVRYLYVTRMRIRVYPIRMLLVCIRILLVC